ncbi:MAG: AarF/ABC1/UbiB kinase family protein [Ktedonobacteraceae bacterium]|nr:AarF/ABC1/UbiB kinase family protein [Ktedonobacteraceae bacterium]
MAIATPRVNRLSQIVRFFKVARLLLWTLWVIYRERQRVVRARARGNYEVKPDIDVLIKVLTAFRATAIKLGVLMIKLGQFLSSRADLLPERALEVLASLQDEVPPAPFEHVVYVIESELGRPVNEVFSSLEQNCTAAASLGQVHKGVLAKTGETVAVKVQRPDIERLVRTDLSTLHFVIWLITHLVDTGEFIDLMGIYREFRRTVFEEIDYVTEAANVTMFREMFSDDPTIFVPRVYDEYVARRVLVLEWVEGIKINDYAALDAAGVDRLEAAKRMVSAYFHQFFDEGVFHADPHPGNIFVKRGSPPDGPVIAFVDFGMVGRLTNSMRRSMRDMFISFVTRDTRAMVDALERLGFLGEGANHQAIARALGLMLEQYYGMTLGEVRQLNMPEVASEIEDLIYGQPFRVPAQFAFTGRAIGTLVGVTTGLAPDFNFIEVATPYARRFLGLDEGNMEQTVQQILSQVLDSGRVLLALPRALERMIDKIDAGQMEVRVAPVIDGGRRRRGFGRRGRRRNGNAVEAVNDRPVGSLSLAFAFAASLSGGIFLSSIHETLPGWFCLGIAGVTALAMIFKR